MGCGPSNPVNESVTDSTRDVHLQEKPGQPEAEDEAISFKGGSGDPTLRPTRASARPGARVSADVQLESFTNSEVEGSSNVRASVLSCLEDCVGPVPAERTWRDEFTTALVLEAELAGESDLGNAASKLTCEQNIRQKMGECNGAVGMRVDEMVEHGWQRDHAECVRLLTAYAGGAIRKALSEGRRDLAASVHALMRVFGERAGLATECPPPLYCALRGVRGSDGRVLSGLISEDSRFARLISDKKGNGVAALAPLTFSPDPWRLCEGGCCSADPSDGLALVVHPGEVVCIASRPHTSSFHAAVQIGYQPPLYALPPNTLVELDTVAESPFTASVPRWGGCKINANGCRPTTDRKTGRVYTDVGDHYINALGAPATPKCDTSATIERQVHQRLLTCVVTFEAPDTQAPATHTRTSVQA